MLWLCRLYDLRHTADEDKAIGLGSSRGVVVLHSRGVEPGLARPAGRWRRRLRGRPPVWRTAASGRRAGHLRHAARRRHRTRVAIIKTEAGDAKLTETDTRQGLINPLFRALQWDFTDFDSIKSEPRVPEFNEPVDYAFYKVPWSCKKARFALS